MKTLSLAFLAFAAAMPAHATIIGFEGLSDGDVVTAQFPGVVFSSTAGSQNQVTDQPGIGIGDNFLCTAPIGGSINCSDETILTFSQNVQNLSFYSVGVNDVGTVAMVDVFENGAFSSSVPIPGFGVFSTPNLVDLSSFLNVSSIRIHSITDGGGIGWDEFSYDVSRVPLPASVALLGSALIGGALFTKRRGAG